MGVQDALKSTSDRLTVVEAALTKAHDDLVMSKLGAVVHVARKKLIVDFANQKGRFTAPDPVIAELRREGFENSLADWQTYLVQRNRAEDDPALPALVNARYNIPYDTHGHLLQGPRNSVHTSPGHDEALGLLASSLPTGFADIE